MKRNLFSNPDSFSISPALSILPVIGDISSLEALGPSLFARYERVSALIREFKGGDSSVPKAYISEQQMLRQVLDWLSMNPEAGN